MIFCNILQMDEETLQDPSGQVEAWLNGSPPPKRGREISARILP
jgi:hypothetical protein